MVKLDKTIHDLTEKKALVRVVGKIMRLIMGWKARNPRQWTSWSIDEFLTASVKLLDLPSVQFALSHNASSTHDSSYALCMAARLGQLPTVKLLIHYGASPNANADVSGYRSHKSYELVTTPLVHAVACQRHSIISYLIKEGADMTANNHQALKVAAKQNTAATLRLLALHSADLRFDGDQLLWTAIRAGSEEVVRNLLREHGLDANGRDGAMLYQACYTGNAGIVKELLECGADPNRAYQGVYPLAVARGLDMVETLVQHGADPGPGLREACRTGSIGVVECLVMNGADAFLEDSWPLRVAAERGATSFVEYLLKKGCDAHVCEDQSIKHAALAGHTATVSVLLFHATFDPVVLSWAAYGAAMTGYLGVVQLLAAHGADLQFREQLLLRHTVRAGYLGVVEYLLEQGSKMYVKPSAPLKEEGAHTAVEEAILRGERRVLRMVLEKGKCWEDPEGLKHTLEFARGLERDKEVSEVVREVVPAGHDDWFAVL
ncbi:hypothetical protein HDV00_003935 [Rhizophlyctis rosea]|nr:hypothetical protein HDV00_003935 [Rhizophlyctis rosea]